MAEETDEYIALPQDIDCAKTALEQGSLRHFLVQDKFYHLMRWAIFVIVVCTVIDTLLLLHLGVQQTRTKLSWSDTTDTMEFRSPYVNLDFLYRNTSLRSSQHGPIVNHAHSIGLVSATEPQKVFRQNDTGWINPNYGFIPLENRRILVTSEISTVVQFRILDFGMESCSLAITIPRSNKDFGPMITSSSQNRTVNLDIWALPTKRKLDLRTLSWTTRPQPRVYIGALAVTYDDSHTDQTPRFACQSGSYQTFEIGCSSADCHMDIWSTGKAASGLYIYQYQTV